MVGISAVTGSRVAPAPTKMPAIAASPSTASTGSSHTVSHHIGGELPGGPADEPVPGEHELAEHVAPLHVGDRRRLLLNRAHVGRAAPRRKGAPGRVCPRLHGGIRQHPDRRPPHRQTRNRQIRSCSTHPPGCADAHCGSNLSPSPQDPDPPP